MSNRGRSNWVKYLAGFLTLLLAGCNGFFTSPNLTTITVEDSNGNTTPSINVGQTDQMVAVGTFDDGSRQNVSATWSITTGNNSVATISATGLVKAVALGTATVMAASSGITGTASVTVCSNTITAITISPTDQTISQSANTLQYTAKDQAGNNITDVVTWTSSSTSVAQISGTGLATFEGTGTTTITANSCTVSASTQLTVD